ncbi:hypothetical protein PR202_ga29361 [Eleusine coracana subsp. coracana]|uniref:GDSL esterase/lipase n=1 Tax=Eleusine coracana subsp. coracana TaxID=191504 RepID=A0AAV5DJR7_ELECO|nr:hypothetical protein PR202_ga29361 [Eleusine coracana subsp. coracana]
MTRPPVGAGHHVLAVLHRLPSSTGAARCRPARLHRTPQRGGRVSNLHLPEQGSARAHPIAIGQTATAPRPVPAPYLYPPIRLEAPPGHHHGRIHTHTDTPALPASLSLLSLALPADPAMVATAAAAAGRAALLLLLVLALADLRVSAAADCNFPAVFNFGDSNSDTGGLSATFGAAPPPNGRTFFGVPSGRYCDGRLVIDFIAESLGIPYLSAYLNSIGTNFSHGANFATAGSSIRRQNTSLFLSGFSPISLDVQSWEFDQFMNRSQFIYNNKGGVYRQLLPKGEYFSKALYTFDIGQNDITSSYFVNQSTEEVEAIIPDLMERLTSVIESVLWHGGKYFWIHNTGPLGCLPYALMHRPDLAAPMDDAGCSVKYNKVAQLFNLRLKETVASLRKKHPDAAFTYVDVYTAKYRLISQAKKLGFDDPLLTCCGHGGRYNFDLNIGCGGKAQVNGTWVVVGACDDPSKRVSWDGVHFTEAANKFVFDQIVAGALSDPPMAPREACHSRGVQ